MEGKNSFNGNATVVNLADENPSIYLSSLFSRLTLIHAPKNSTVRTWCGEEYLFSYVSLFPSMEKRNPFLLMLSSDSDLWNSSSSFSSPPDCSFCFLFFLRFRLSFALFELNLEASEELSESLPAALGSLECSDAVAAAACCIEEKSFQCGARDNFLKSLRCSFGISCTKYKLTKANII